MKISLVLAITLPLLLGTGCMINPSPRTAHDPTPPRETDATQRTYDEHLRRRTAEIYRSQKIPDYLAAESTARQELRTLYPNAKPSADNAPR
jgi:hypothetical protein